MGQAICKANASELGKLGNQLRWARYREEKSRPVVTPPLSAEVQRLPTPIAVPDKYLAKRLARTRKQIENLSDLLDAETDPAKLDRIAAAIERLSRIEQNLADRPLPGSKRPAPDRPNRRQLDSLRSVLSLPEPVQAPCGSAPTTSSVPVPAPALTPPQDQK